MSEDQALSTENDVSVVVYVGLADEGIKVWRPTRALLKGSNVVMLQPSDDYDPEDEVWEFLPGQLVVVEERRLEGESVLVVTQLAA